MADAEAIAQRKWIVNAYAEKLTLSGTNLAPCVEYGLLPSLLPTGDPSEATEIVH